MTASPEEGLQRLMESLERIPEEYSRRINLKKTKVMMFTNCLLYTSDAADE